VKGQGGSSATSAPGTPAQAGVLLAVWVKVRHRRPGHDGARPTLTVAAKPNRVDTPGKCAGLADLHRRRRAMRRCAYDVSFGSGRVSVRKQFYPRLNVLNLTCAAGLPVLLGGGLHLSSAAIRTSATALKLVTARRDVARKVLLSNDFRGTLGPQGASPQSRRAKAGRLAANGQAQ